MPKLFLLLVIILSADIVNVLGFAPSSRFVAVDRPRHYHVSFSPSTACQNTQRVVSFLQSSSSPSDEESEMEELTSEEIQQQQQQIGNLVADAEWAGLSMEIADVVRTAVIEDLKKNSREFLNKDEYLVGDFSKEIDKRVKAEIAKIREKDEYEVSIYIYLLSQ